MTLRRTIHRREARKRAKARKLVSRPYRVSDLQVEGIFREVYEDYVREQVGNQSLAQLFKR